MGSKWNQAIKVVVRRQSRDQQLFSDIKKGLAIVLSFEPVNQAIKDDFANQNS